MAGVRRESGFTLIEVMVALAVVAIALPALIISLYQQVDGTAHIRDKSIAQMVAANRLSELRLISAATEPLRPGSSEGMSEMAAREWYWWLETTITDVDTFYRVEVNVAAQEELREQPLYTLVAFMQGESEQEGDNGDSQ